MRASLWLLPAVTVVRPILGQEGSRDLDEAVVHSQELKTACPASPLVMAQPQL